MTYTAADGRISCPSCLLRDFRVTLYFNAFTMTKCEAAQSKISHEKHEEDTKDKKNFVTSPLHRLRKSLSFALIPAGGRPGPNLRPFLSRPGHQLYGRIIQEPTISPVPAKSCWYFIISDISTTGDVPPGLQSSSYANYARNLRAIDCRWLYHCHLAI